MIGAGNPNNLLGEAEVGKLLHQAFDSRDLLGKKVLAIIPDGTRTAPLPMFFRQLYQIMGDEVAALDYLVALGTHPQLSEPALHRLVGITPEERADRHPKVRLFNHRWDLPGTWATVGEISAEETEALSGGLLAVNVPVRINRMVLEYDLILVCGPVFPHEVAGFSGGNKYFFPGISGPEVINFTHWMGALVTSYAIIGTKETPVRAVIDRAASMIPGEKICLCMVVDHQGLNGLYIGDPREAWSAAVELSAQIHVRYVEHPFQQALSVMPRLYNDLWTAAKGMYKLEPVIADGGEVIIYAPHLTEISYTHGAIIDRIGYHVRDYFLKQWDQFKDYPWGVLAHSTHLRGIGSYEAGIEKPRIKVTLATGIPVDRCERVNLGYCDPGATDLREWENREPEGILLVPRAGEILYRLSTTTMGVTHGEM